MIKLNQRPSNIVLLVTMLVGTLLPFSEAYAQYEPPLAVNRVMIYVLSGLLEREQPYSPEEIQSMDLEQGIDLLMKIQMKQIGPLKKIVLSTGLTNVSDFTVNQNPPPIKGQTSRGIIVFEISATLKDYNVEFTGRVPDDRELKTLPELGLQVEFAPPVPFDLYMVEYEVGNDERLFPAPGGEMPGGKQVVAKHTIALQIEKELIEKKQANSPITGQEEIQKALDDGDIVRADILFGKHKPKPFQWGSFIFWLLVSVAAVVIVGKVFFPNQLEKILRVFPPIRKSVKQP